MDDPSNDGLASTRQRPVRRRQTGVPHVLVIGASTGGPQALSSLLAQLSPDLDSVPVLVVLHMPPDFTDVVSAHIERATNRATRAARNGEEIHPGRIYVAPGNCHLRVARLAGVPILLHCDTPPENFCRPAVDVLFRSVAKVYGSRALGIILTGMGSDGLEGSRALVEAGGSVIAQDQASSVVWGMPGAVVQQGLASAVLPLDAMASEIAKLLRKSAAGVAA